MSAPPAHLTVCDGKYTLIMDAGNLRALRYGEAWRDLAGDGFVMALGHEIEELSGLLRDAASLFRTYEAHHRAKASEAGRPEKAERNAEIAGRIETKLRTLSNEPQPCPTCGAAVDENCDGDPLESCPRHAESAR